MSTLASSSGTQKSASVATQKMRKPLLRNAALFFLSTQPVFVGPTLTCSSHNSTVALDGMMCPYILSSLLHFRCWKLWTARSSNWRFCWSRKKVICTFHSYILFVQNIHSLDKLRVNVLVFGMDCLYKTSLQTIEWFKSFFIKLSRKKSMKHWTKQWSYILWDLGIKIR